MENKIKSVSKGKSGHEEYSELNTEPCSEFTRSLKTDDHDDCVQLLKGTQPQ